MWKTEPLNRNAFFLNENKTVSFIYILMNVAIFNTRLKKAIPKGISCQDCQEQGNKNADRIRKVVDKASRYPLTSIT